MLTVQIFSHHVDLYPNNQMICLVKEEHIQLPTSNSTMTEQAKEQKQPSTWLLLWWHCSVVCTITKIIQSETFCCHVSLGPTSYPHIEWCSPIHTSSVQEITQKQNVNLLIAQFIDISSNSHALAYWNTGSALQYFIPFQVNVKYICQYQI